MSTLTKHDPLSSSKKRENTSVNDPVPGESSFLYSTEQVSTFIDLVGDNKKCLICTRSQQEPLWTFKKLPFCQVMGVCMGYVIKLSEKIKPFGKGKKKLYCNLNRQIFT